MNARTKPKDIEAVRWAAGMAHRQVSTCSCHPGQYEFCDSSGEREWLVEGDWILMDVASGESWVVTNAEFQKQYDVIAS